MLAKVQAQRHAQGRRLSATILAGAALTVLVVSACGSNSTSARSAGGGNTSSAMTTGSPHGAASAGAMVKTTNGKLGTFLTDATGRTIYVFAADTTTQSTCYNSCASFWPPVLTSGAPSASGGVAAAKLGTTKRTDGTTQVTYNGHPLYTFKPDSAPGETNGQGKNLSGGLWWVVGANGTAITSSGGSSGSSSGSSGSSSGSSSSSGGGGYGGGY
jgi:predicted lipoprotein with Yx(FWY)xxD motif